jgi:hypothetical protein
VALLPQNSSDTGGYSSSVLAGRGAFAPHSSEAAALRGLGAGPSALTRVAAGLLLRQVVGGVMSAASIEVAVHGLLLPALHMQVGAGLLLCVVCVHACVRAHAYVCACVCFCVYARARACVDAVVRACDNACRYACAHACVCSRLRACVHGLWRAGVSVRLRVRVCVYACLRA